MPLLTPRLRAALVALPTALLLIGASPALAGPPPGPETCLVGYVWRAATPSDQVCVTPKVRNDTAADNASAAARRNPTGAYGPDTCISGYVWREAVAGDHVCVTLDTRSQAAADNAEAPNRRNSLRVWSEPASVLQRVVLHVDHVNTGAVTIRLYRSANLALIDEYAATASPAGYMPGGRLDLTTRQCGFPGGPGGYYYVIRDDTSLRTTTYYPLLNIYCLA